jgi:hypothetical protein
MEFSFGKPNSDKRSRLTNGEVATLVSGKIQEALDRSYSDYQRRLQENQEATVAVLQDTEVAHQEQLKATEERFEVIVQEAIDKALLEAEAWKTDIRSAISPDDFKCGNIFEAYPYGINFTTGKEVDRKGTSLTEADYSAVGTNPYQNPENIQTVEKLRLMQSASIYQWINYPISRSIIENLKRYALGRGVKIGCVVPEVSKVLKNFWTVNGMERRNKLAFQTYLLEGEYFPMLFDNAEAAGFDPEIDSLVLVRSLPSYQVIEIESDPDDAETKLAYKREKPMTGGASQYEWYLDGFHPVGDEREYGLPITSNGATSQNISEVKTDSPKLLFFKHGLSQDERGRVIMESVLRWNRVAVDFLYTRSRLQYLRSKIFLIEERLGSKGKVTAASSSTEKMPQGGIKLVETVDRKYRFESPNTGADDAEKDYKAILYMIGSALSMPIHILQMNAENENYASIKEAANPFTQMILDLQDEWGEWLRMLLRYVILAGIRKGVLKSEYEIEYLPEDNIGEIYRYVDDSTRAGVPVVKISEAVDKMVKAARKTTTVKTVNVPVDVIFPIIVQTDPTAQAGALQIYQNLGLMSKRTAQLQLGLDPDIEASRLSSEYQDSLDRRDEAIGRMNAGKPDAVGTENPPAEEE